MSEHTHCFCTTIPAKPATMFEQAKPPHQKCCMCGQMKAIKGLSYVKAYRS